MKCEIVREGQTCDNTAELIVRTPWATQLVCAACATAFKRYESSPLEFFCDWPVGGKECGERATHYLEVKDRKTVHRPLCAEHASHTFTRSTIDDEHFNPKLVPYKPPPQQPRVAVGADGSAQLRCYCGKEGKFRGGVWTMPLCDEHAPVAVLAVQPAPPVYKFVDILLCLPMLTKSELKAVWRVAKQLLKEKSNVQ